MVSSPGTAVLLADAGAVDAVAELKPLVSNGAAVWAGGLGAVA
jgi:hypothetical protein